ncbi:MAG TPA: glycosyltransferase family 4 protein [Candidatus Xenobia bacterium]|nr:glycosyltransferase family 4 protein [Candidatus Xenobia bacterium]
MARLKVMVLTHAYLAEENRKKLSLLGREVELEVVSPDRATTPLFRYRIERRVLEGPSYTMRFYRPLPERGIPARNFLLSANLDMERFRPDVLHLEAAPWALMSAQALRCARQHVPQAAVVCTVRQNTYTRYGPLTAMKDWLARRGIRRIDRFIAGNAGSREILVQRFGVSPETIDSNLQLGVDTELFRPATSAERRQLRRAWRLAEDAVVVGYCGRFVEEKGLRALVEAVRAVRTRTGARLQLALLGDGPLRGWLEQADSDIVLHRTVAHAEVASFLRALDVFVLPSLIIPEHEEHDAHALLEALSCGVASIGTESGAIPEILQGAGLLVPPAALEKLGEAVAQLLTPAARKPWEEAGRQRILERYSNERIVERQMRTYHQALAHRRQRG